MPAEAFVVADGHVIHPDGAAVPIPPGVGVAVVTTGGLRIQRVGADGRLTGAVTRVPAGVPAAAVAAAFARAGEGGE